jgi:hypothetical protein
MIVGPCLYEATAAVSAKRSATLGEFSRIHGQDILAAVKYPLSSGKGWSSKVWPVSRLLVHLLRFSVLQVGLLVVGELLFASFSCLQHIERLRTLGDVAECSTVAFVFLMWIGLPYLAIHLVPVVILACAGTAIWAWLDRRRLPK